MLHVAFCLVVIDDKTFEGVGSSKKQARNEAAQAALRMSFGLERTNPPKPPSTSTQPDKPLDCEFGDFIAK